MKIFILMLLALISHLAFAVKEEDLARQWPEKILPFYESMESGEFKNSQGLKISYKFLVKEKNQSTLVVLPGQGEPALKYAETLYDLKDSDHNLFILDHQGQGHSERLLADSQRGYVRFFQDYVDDLAFWVRKHVMPKSQGLDLYLLAHSMGGAISTHYLAQNPGVFKKAALSAPMLQIDTAPHPERRAKFLASFLVKIGLGKKYAPGYGPYRPEEDTPESDKFTSSPERHAITKLIKIDFPETVIGGPTSRWVDQSLKATHRIEDLAKKLQLPLLLFQAGKDTVVRTPIQESFCSKAPHCLFVSFPNAKHEILMEKDVDRNEAMKEIKNFFSSQSRNEGHR